MQDLHVTSWQLFGHDRLYVNLPDGTAIGWADLASGTITVLHPSYRDAVTDALARQVPGIPALCEAEPPGPPAPPPIPPLPRFRRTRLRERVQATAREPAPTPAPVREPGRESAQEPAPVQERAPVPAQAPVPAPLPVQAQVRAHTQVPVPVPVPVEAPLEAPPEAPVGTPGPGPEPRHPEQRPVLPALTPENDLASRCPGAELRAELAGSGPAELVRAATGALRRRSETDPRRTALTGERRVGAELKRLTRQGWRLLHSVPLPDGTHIGHLLIGPGGVFTVTTQAHPGAKVWLGDGTLRIDDDDPRPYVLERRSETRRAQQMLEAHCTFAVPVQWVLVFVGAASLEVLATPPGVRVCRERQVSALAPLTGVLTPTQVERVYDVARNREAWLDA